MLVAYDVALRARRVGTYDKLRGPSPNRTSTQGGGGGAYDKPRRDMFLLYRVLNVRSPKLGCYVSTLGKNRMLVEHGPQDLGAM